MRVVEIKVYTIDDHPNKELCFEWINDNWHDLNEFSVSDLVNSIQALSKEIGGTVNWSISQTPDRGEHITFRDYDEEILNELKAEDLPLTGVCWDHDVIEGLQENDMKKVLDVLHKDTEYVYSNIGLTEHCQCNNYEFNENGSFHC